MKINFVDRIKAGSVWRYKNLQASIKLIQAKIWRASLNKAKFIGITGSVGKTTTKDLTVSVLEEHGKTKGNTLSLNYLSDIAKAIVELPRNVRFVVLEIATSGPGTIDDRVQLCRPDIAAMIVIGRDHIKKFGSMEAIAEEKAKLINALPETGTAVLNQDDPLIRNVAAKTKAQKLWFGTSEDADLRLLDATSNYPETLVLKLIHEGHHYTCTTGIYGIHLAVPVLAAIGIGLAAGLSIEDAIVGVANAKPTTGRMQIVTDIDGVTFLRDDYKAPHWTLQTVLDFMANAKAERKVAIIGTLSDYSLSASKLYPKVARKLREVADLVVFVGPHALRALKARNGEDDIGLQGFTQIRDAHRFLEKELRQGDLVILKGSNRADHLVRLILARQQHVGCWIADCGKNRFCDRCEFIEGNGVVDTQVCPPAEADIDLSITASSPYLIVGLGNQGTAYDDTPHNMGAAVLDRLAQSLGNDKEWVDVPEGTILQANIEKSDVILFKPGAMINHCGPMVDALRRRMSIHPKKIIVAHDDTDLPLSEVRLKYSGSDSGHKGLRSIFSALGNDGFMTRVRVGVRTSNNTDHDSRAIVLKRFSEDDGCLVIEGLEKSSSLIRDALNARR